MADSKQNANHWLITGGCGFIGRTLIESILQDSPDDGIRVIDNLGTGTRDDLSQVCSYQETHFERIKGPPAGVELVVGDILDVPVLSACATGIDVLVHLAANTGVAPSVADPKYDLLNNVVGTFNALEAARQQHVPRFVFASSGAPIGEVEPPIHEELAPHPVSPYGASKLAGEAYCSAYWRTFGVSTVCLRFGNVYGPFSGHKNSVVAKFIKQAMAGQPLVIYGDGQQTRDFIYIGDLVRAVRMAANRDDLGGEVFQIATNSETTVAELTEKLILVLERFGYRDLTVVRDKPRLGDVRRNYSDTSKAKARFGWQSEIDLETGLEKTVAWFQKDS